MLNIKNSEKSKNSKKVNDLLAQFDLLSNEEKRDFLMQICDKSFDDIFTKELMLKMCGNMMKNSPMREFMESFFKNKKGAM